MMSEEVRQKWINIAMDLMAAYYDACDEPHGLSLFLRPMCDRVADAIGDGATGEAVWESLQRRLRSMKLIGLGDDV